MILRGLDADTQEQITGEKCTARIWYGTLNNLGLDKKQDRFLQKYFITVFDFKRPRTGVVAVVKDKFNDATVIVIGVGPDNNFNRVKFRDFVKSIDFKAEIYDPDELDKKGD